MAPRPNPNAARAMLVKNEAAAWLPMAEFYTGSILEENELKIDGRNDE